MVSINWSCPAIFVVAPLLLLLLFPGATLFAGALDDVKAGFAAVERGDGKEAVTLLTRAIDSGELSIGNRFLARVNRGNLFLEEGRYDRAVEDFTSAITVNPLYALVYYNRSLARHFQGKHDIAIEDFNRAITLDSKMYHAFYSRGLSSIGKGQFGSAIKDLSKAIELEPGDAYTYNSLSWLLATVDQGKFRDGKRAVELAKKAVELTGAKESGPLDTLAAAYAEAGDFNSAKGTQKEAILLASEKKEIETYKKRLALYEAGTPYREK